MQLSGRPAQIEQSANYQIRVLGVLDGDWSDWFNGMTLACESTDPPIATLTGFVVDQPALRGILNRLWDLNLILASVTRLDQDARNSD